MLNYIDCPCDGCEPPERTPTCHATCKKYKRFEFILRQENNRIYKEQKIQNSINEICINGALNTRRPQALKRDRSEKNGRK